MKNAPEHEFRRIQEEIKRHFNFLFERGFRIVSVIFIDPQIEFWEITMLSKDSLIKIYNDDKGEIMLAISTLRLYANVGFFDLHELAYFSGKVKKAPRRDTKNFLKTEEQQFERLSNLLKTHIDDVIVWLDQTYDCKDELCKAAAKQGI